MRLNEISTGPVQKVICPSLPSLISPPTLADSGSLCYQITPNRGCLSWDMSSYERKTNLGRATVFNPISDIGEKETKQRTL